MQTILFNLFTGVWQLLRALALILILIHGWFSVRVAWNWVESPKRERVLYDPYVCGQISGYILRYSRSYVVFWPEYEGKSSWEPGFIYNKTGCDANLRSLWMFTSWPEMKPRVKGWFSRNRMGEFDGLSIVVRPYLKSIQEYLAHASKYITADELSEVGYMKDIGLFHVRGTGPAWRDSSSEYYWAQKNGEVEHMIVCPWLPVQNRHSMCTATFIISELEAEVEVEFRFEMLGQWREITNASIDFINGGLIGSN
ncbi:MAG: hypothetical protein LBJ37_19865 [Paucimonas sp.]|jgi:hypothetical protein|nr:hypothetical protein [Paucimonas sp.]